ncbi:hypothetical protein CC1G_05654 [Coprinopsis cinerea okayama7|uniref:Uncharacterized protein n=1 Tax=Coprinopsis cinerea (strain Okayama-7 / 130 / ATCC MYA-4618 / FGSC 9003) TaxID=240176 RepID=A8P1T5_COPC7|nr:hypothetical protein CC1G_05654 [Coprinopsis cinerea okayama7\|eukprot:XP_001838173.2 hypothetical protein CC1G_05654 [Coprinopsis cinerea okayama7\
MSIRDYIYWYRDDLRRALLIRNYEEKIKAWNDVVSGYVWDDGVYEDDNSDEGIEAGAPQIDSSSTWGNPVDDDDSLGTWQESDTDNLLSLSEEASKTGISDEETNPLEDENGGNISSTVSEETEDAPSAETELHPLTDITRTAINGTALDTKETNLEGKCSHAETSEDVQGIVTESEAPTRARQGKRKAAFEDDRENIQVCATTGSSKRTRIAAEPSTVDNCVPPTLQ